ncbi:hypothetical protein COCCADRAFT_27491 [Bipolaris zeicola 26-R-13]|uniref:Uncharacterized protein n=1 Tax=Cochliobolus carbonum (strain 26-R-13) TaxID=930089 RepID=W6Y1U8_COCC2|nr:uncharacterized protein COCCADRAFT_27491 [Bipolaris zeicola 26-R-13]EUC31878.1 hypothetical protein COCCADRAFT_27491 [Bipolaris zeicola 26-R-13]
MRGKEGEAQRAAGGKGQREGGQQRRRAMKVVMGYGGTWPDGRIGKRSARACPPQTRPVLTYVTLGGGDGMRRDGGWGWDEDKMGQMHSTRTKHRGSRETNERGSAPGYEGTEALLQAPTLYIRHAYHLDALASPRLALVLTLAHTYTPAARSSLSARRVKQHVLVYTFHAWAVPHRF